MDTPFFSEDEYPNKFLRGYSIFPDDARIFHRADCGYDHVSTLNSFVFRNDVAHITASLASGEPVSLSVEAVHPKALRLKVWQGQPAFDQESSMLVQQPPHQARMQPDETKDVYSLTLADYRLELDKHPFCLRVISPEGEPIFESETETLVGLYTAPPLGFRKKGMEKWAFLSWKMQNEDRFYGLGEKFTRFEKRSSRATIWQADTCGSNTTDMSYKAVPVLLCTAGWAMMLHTSYRSYWEIGSFSYATGAAMLEDSKLDLFLILAPTLKEQIEIYTALTGRPTLPPKWAFGLWMSRAAYTSRVQMLEVADRLRQEGIPCDVFNIDPTWLGKGYYNDIGVEVCNFEWEETAWSPAEKLFAEFASKGYSICLWINPYFSEDSAAYAEAREKGYLVRDLSGGIARLEFGLAAGIVDFTNPEAKAWWKEKLLNLLRKGAAVFKVDFGDRVPEDALFYNGKTGKEMHNLYVHLYAGTVYEAVREAKGVGLVWRRPGYIGSQRYPACWAGDTQVTWQGMHGALRGGLSAAMTGEAFWSHDMGGFVGAKPSEELYIRWAQWGLLSPLSRFHGTTPREPWYYGEKAVEVVKYYANLRYTLIPYLMALAYESTMTGLPIMRPLALEFPDEPHIDQVDDQFLLGRDLLVAPVFKEGARWRMAYFPWGQWRRLDDRGPVISGPDFAEVEAPLERLPVYVRSGAVLPRYAQPPQHLKGSVPQQWILDITPGISERRLMIPETDFRVEIDYRADHSGSHLHVNPVPLTLTIQLLGRGLDSIPVRQARWQAGEGCVTLTLDAYKGVELTF